MERQPKTPEPLTYRERQKLIKDVLTKADIYLTQLVGATAHIRKNYIPILSSTSLLIDRTQVEDQISAAEKAHLRKIIAIQADVLQVADQGLGRLSEFRESIESVAGSEIVQWRDIQQRQEVLPRGWRFAQNDSTKITDTVREAVDLQQQ